nr:hypothetical protein CFP56_36406 [Quercus suber]
MLAASIVREQDQISIVSALIKTTGSSHQRSHPSLQNTPSTFAWKRNIPLERSQQLYAGYVAHASTFFFMAKSHVHTIPSGREDGACNILQQNARRGHCVLFMSVTSVVFQVVQRKMTDAVIWTEEAVLGRSGGLEIELFDDLDLRVTISCALVAVALAYCGENGTYDMAACFAVGSAAPVTTRSLQQRFQLALELLRYLVEQRARHRLRSTPCLVPRLHDQAYQSSHPMRV